MDFFDRVEKKRRQKKYKKEVRQEKIKTKISPKTKLYIYNLVNILKKDRIMFFLGLKIL